jgi:valyl-tRNA synthetase
MIIAGYEYTDKKPFTNVYLTGLSINNDENVEIIRELTRPIRFI